MWYYSWTENAPDSIEIQWKIKKTSKLHKFVCAVTVYRVFLSSLAIFAGGPGMTIEKSSTIISQRKNLRQSFQMHWRDENDCSRVFFIPISSANYCQFVPNHPVSILYLDIYCFCCVARTVSFLSLLREYNYSIGIFI